MDYFGIFQASGSSNYFSSKSDTDLKTDFRTIRPTALLTLYLGYI